MFRTATKRGYVHLYRNIQVVPKGRQKHIPRSLTRVMSTFSNISAQTTRNIFTNDTQTNSAAATQTATEHYSHNLSPKLEVSPRVCLFDVPTNITVSGLQPNIPVTLTLLTFDEKNVPFTSLAHYVSNERGNIDLQKFESVGGSYKGVFQHGLLSSLAPPPGKHTFRRITPIDTRKPLVYNLSLYEGHKELDQCLGQPMQEVTMERYVKAPNVRRIEVEEGRIRGAIFVPEGPGPFPAVIDMFGVAAKLMEHRSSMLASRGFVSYALSYFGYRDLPQEIKSFEFEYFEEAVNYLLTIPEVIPDRCGVIAACQGGAVGLLMGTYIDKVKAVFAVNTNNTLYESTITHKGIPMLPTGHKLCSDELIFDEEHLGRPNYELVKKSYLSIDDPKTLRLEDASEDTQFFFAAGGDCHFLSTKSSEILQERLARKGHTNFRRKVYPGAGHIMEVPYGPYISKCYQMYFPYKNKEHTVPKVGAYLSWGGNAYDTCKAQEDLWNDMQSFLRTEIEGKSEWYQDHLNRQAVSARK